MPPTPTPTPAVTPNRRGARSREAVLDAAERLIAEHGYEAAAVSALVKEAGIPASSIYHYFGSKEGVLLAVMQRGAERFFGELPTPARRQGTQQAHLHALLDGVATTLGRHPDFLRILIVLSAQPADAGRGEVHRVVARVRDLALERLRVQMQLAFDLDPAGAEADHLARFWLAAVDGAFVAWQADPQLDVSAVLAHLPEAVVAVRRALARPA